MAITYHAGRRIQKLDNDTIPTASTCDTFTSDNWTDVGGLFGVSGKQFHFQISTSARDDHASLDTGSLLSASTTWTLRFNKINFSTITNNDPNLIIGLSDTTVGGKQNQKFIGARILPQGGSASGLFRPYSVNGTPPRAGQDASHTLQYSADTDYYVEIKKTASNAYRARLSTTPDHSGDLVDSSQGGINSSITGRYIKVMNGESEIGGTLIGTIDSIEFWTPAPSDSDHKTENQMPLNNQVGSRLEETNTRKMYNFSKLTFDFSASSSGAVSNQPTDATEVGQLITSTTHRGKKAKSATFYVQRVGSPGGTMVYKIRKSSDNSVVATSTGTSASALSTSKTAVTLNFNDEDIPSENIRVTVSGVTGSSGNLVTIYGGGSDTVADQSLSVWGGSSWTEYGNDCAGKLTFTEEWQEIGA